MSEISIIKACAIANMRRVIYLLETTDLDNVSFWSPESPNYAEIKQKMKEIRRDTIKIEKHLNY